MVVGTFLYNIYTVRLPRGAGALSARVGAEESRFGFYLWRTGKTTTYHHLSVSASPPVP